MLEYKQTKASAAYWFKISTICLLFSFVIIKVVIGQPISNEITRIQQTKKTGFSNGGWKYDRYSELESLDAKKSIVVADLTGPGIITHIHTTRHNPEELFSRGIVLEIYFDDAEEPAVCSPLGDFFGDGCNGKSMDFSSLLIECAPGSYNCYFPMPFKTSARVILRNDTENNAMNYSYVEWESLPEWDEELGYFHASYNRKCFQLSPQSNEVFFEINGSGHIIGRQLSIATDDPYFRKFGTVMEGNNEVDIDSKVRCIDYLGTEDSFTFSWGFQNTFAGLRAGMTYVQPADSQKTNESRLSIYRFHDHMPIRFNESLKWTINWRQEKNFVKNPKWLEAVEKNGCWVDYASVFYWYLNDPGGYKHQSLPPVEERQKQLLCPPN